MAETSDPRFEDGKLRSSSAAMTASETEAWFVREVLPLETALMQFLRRNWQNESDIADLMQEVYVRVFESAQRQLPEQPRHFVFTTARNLLIDRVRRESVVPIDAVTDLDVLGIAIDAPSPDRTIMAREELRKLQSALDRLPAKYRDVIVLRRVEGLNGREIAQRLGISESAVSKHIDAGMRALADIYYGEPADLRRKS
jgi:RNA polymerase sigma factor (sigma-70 family)